MAHVSRARLNVLQDLGPPSRINHSGTLPDTDTDAGDGARDDEIAQYLEGRLRAAPTVLPDIDDIRKGTKRRRTTIMASAVGGLIAIVAVAGGLIAAGAPGGTAATNSVAAPAPTTDRPTTEPALPLAEDTTGAPDVTERSEADQTVIVEPPPTQVRTPHLVTIDGQGAFAGARSPAFRNPRSAIFTTSADGKTWEFASRLPLSDYEFVKRFERIGDHYFAWIDNALAPNPPNPIHIAMSSDLVAWQIVEIEPPQDPPVGLIYRTTVQDIAVLAPNVVALVSTEIEIDYAALALVESYTCGASISEAGVYIDLCNEALLDVVALPDAEQLPPALQIHVGLFGREPLASTGQPYRPDADPIVSRLADQFGAGVGDQRIDVSLDGHKWQIVRGEPSGSGVVRITAVENLGYIAGVANALGGETRLFRTIDGVSVPTDVATLTGRQLGYHKATVAAGPAGWVVYLAEDDGQTSLFHSIDGTEWTLIEPLVPATDDPRFYVGDDEVLVQTNHGVGPLLTVIPLAVERG